MSQFRTVFKVVKYSYIGLTISLVSCFLIFPIPIKADGPVSHASDLIPPQITIVSPLKDSVAGTGKPRIEVSCEDMGSDIDDTTIHLILDRTDVTALVKIEKTDITGQAVYSPSKISYQPTVSLKQGRHEVDFSVRDLAGNLAELHWSFEIQLPDAEGIHIGGSNTLRFDESPIYKTTDILDLTLQGKLRNTQVQFHILGRTTDYPGGTPTLSDDNYNFYLDHYALGLYHQKTMLVLGHTTTSLNSELLQIGLELNGGLAGASLDTTSGQYAGSIFSGKVASTYGLGIAIFKITGISGKWQSPSGLGLSGFYAGLGDTEGYDFTGIKGNAIILGDGLFRFEAIHGTARADHKGGNGVILHFEKPLASSIIGLDYSVLQPGYPVPGSPLSLIPDRGGMERCGVRSITVIGKGQSINFDGSFTGDNLDHSFNFSSNRGNISLGYNLNPDAAFSFNAGYQGDIQYHGPYSPGKEDQINHAISIGIQKKYEKSSLQSSLSLYETCLPDPNKSMHSVLFFSAWTRPAGIYNLTPSLQWTDEQKPSGDNSGIIDARLTLDMLLHPDLSRSKIALFYHQNNKLTAGQITHAASFGLSSSIYTMLQRNSTLSLNLGCSKWIREEPGYREGWDITLSLAWKTGF